MLKNFLDKAAILAAVVMLPLVTISCSDDDEPTPDPTPNKEVIGVLVTYEAQIDEAMLDYMDVQVSYTGLDGQNVTAAVDSSKWTQSLAYSIDKEGLPTSLNATLSATRNATALPESGSIHIYGDMTASLYLIYSDETASEDQLAASFILSLPTDDTVDINDLNDYLTHNSVLRNFSFGIEYNENNEIANISYSSHN